jgi:hypothetical protein
VIAASHEITGDDPVSELLFATSRAKSHSESRAKIFSFPIAKPALHLLHEPARLPLRRHLRDPESHNADGEGVARPMRGFRDFKCAPRRRIATCCALGN